MREAGGPGPEIVVVTGMSGAGRSTVGKVMEDQGWYVIDNLPISLLPDLLQVSAEREGKLVGDSPIQRIGIVLNVRAQGFETLAESIRLLKERGWRTHLIFLDATNEALVRRFESVRRPHPLQGTGRLLDAIVREREVLADLRATAESVVDTSGLNVHQLGRKVSPLFMTGSAERLRLAVLSFGFKYGVPLDADFVFDMRFLPNPFWVPELRPHTGRETQVADFVLSQPGAQEFIDGVDTLMDPVIAGYQRENRRYVTLAVGCTGGKHRSVAIAEAVAARLASDEVTTFVVHRDLGQE
ncbi:glmZ(sRNA)-inactivating NTPase [Janibacter sp. Soil728]|uniref:RNase adapter RapZ n=1 Tax=Janibacter sp. Soil728 TaxID=1736393 RepID=UPI0006F3A941|nr:RNase adapter RapZ [Janibacter sp. Soil728]KRE37284.1 glmZ(sRNA)-inactivating NTPase [Janibacter sp. Soil728]